MNYLDPANAAQALDDFVALAQIICMHRREELRRDDPHLLAALHTRFDPGSVSRHRLVIDFKPDGTVTIDERIVGTLHGAPQMVRLWRDVLTPRDPQGVQ